MALKILLLLFIFYGFFIGALWKPILGILGYLVVYFIWNPKLWWGRGLMPYLPRPSFIAMVFLIIGSVLHLRRLNWSFSRREIEFYMFLGLIWLTSLSFGIGMEETNWFFLEKMTKSLVFIFLFIRIVKSLNDYRLVVWTFIISAILLTFQSHLASSSFFIDGRLEFLGYDFGEANSLGALAAFGMIFLAIEALRVSWWKKLIFIFGIALMFNTIIMTQSRGIFIGLFITIPYVIFRSPSKNRKQIYVFFILAIVLFLMLADVNFISRMKTMSDELKYDREEVLTRLDFWKSSIKMFKEYPLGVGIKNFQKLVPHYDQRNPGLDAHNTFVLCYTEMGIQGIILFLVIIFETLLQLRRIRLMVINTPVSNEITLFAFALMIVFLMYLTGYMMTHSALYKEIFWILLAMPVSLENVTRELLSN